MSRTLSMILSAWLCTGCAGGDLSTPAEPAAVALPGDWTLGGADPVPAHRPNVVVCEEALAIEPLSGVETLEIDLTRCNYVVATAPTRVPLQAGDTLRIRFVHFQLVGSSGDQAHVLLSLGPTPLWERTIPMPAASASFEDEVVLDAAADVGTPLILHLHNHGLNTYHLVDLLRL